MHNEWLIAIVRRKLGDSKRKNLTSEVFVPKSFSIN